MNFRFTFTSLLLCGVLLSGAAQGAEWGKKNKKNKNNKQTTVQVDTAKQAPKGIPSIADFIKSDTKKQEGRES